MVKIFKNSIKAIIRWALVTTESYDREVPQPSYGSALGSMMAKNSSPSSSIGDHNRGLNFTVYNATGGKIVQIVTYDPRTDRTNSELYIVNEGESLGEEIAQIITRVNLTR
jgi:hypothetical protein